MTFVDTDKTILKFIQKSNGTIRAKTTLRNRIKWEESVCPISRLIIQLQQSGFVTLSERQID